MTVIDSENQTIKPAETGLLLTAPKGDLSLKHVLTQPFEPIASNHLQFDKTAPTEWLKLEVSNTSGKPLTYYLSTTSSADYCDVYLMQNAKLVSRVHGGALVPVRERSYQKHLQDPYIPIVFPPGKSDVYIRLESKRELALQHRDIQDIVLIGAKSFAKITGRNTYVDGMMFGACIIILIFSLLLFFISRERIYLQTFLMLFILSLYPFSALGYLLKFFLADFPEPETYIDYILGNLGAVAIVFTSVRYLKLKEYAPKTARWIYIFVSMQLLLFIPLFFSGTVYKIWLLITAIAVFFLFYGVYKSMRAKYRLSYYYLAGLLTLSVMFFIFLFRWFGWISYETFIKLYNGQLFVAGFGFFLLLGLTDRFFQIRREALEKQIAGERAIRKAEEEKTLLVEEQKRELERKVAERTAEIAKKNRQLQKLNEIKSRFFANISHEFRTPLTLIVGPVENYLKTGKTQLSVEELSSILENAHQLLNLINQLLDLAKAETGKLDLNEEPVHVASFINECVQSFLPFAETKSISIKTIFDDNRLTTSFDPEKMRQVLNNILKNALKFSPKNSVVSIETFVRKNRLHIEIADEGRGIPDDQKKKVFERFYQYEGQTIAEGTGIGLAIAKEFVEIHGGTIRIEDNHPRGTTFIIEIPLQDSPTSFSPEIKEVHCPKAQEFKRMDRHKPSLLIVEDHHQIRHYIKSCLENEYRFYEAENGKIGIEMARERLPDLIISDIMMPETDGLELIRVLKNDVSTSHIPIILLTARGALEDKIAGLEHGADDYLVKPFNKEELEARVRNLLDNRKRLREAFRKNVLGSSELSGLSLQDQQFLTLAEKAILDHLTDETYDIEAFSKTMLINRTTLFRKLKALTGQSPSQYIRSIRLKKAVQLMKETAMPVNEIAYAVGFGSPAYFTKSFKEQFGATPTEFNWE